MPSRSPFFASARGRLLIFNLLVVAVFVLMLIDPFSVYSAGLWLSFAAVAGIVFAYPMLNTIVSFRFPAFQWLWSLIAVSVAAQIGTLPFSLFYSPALFDRFLTTLRSTAVLSR